MVNGVNGLFLQVCFWHALSECYDPEIVFVVVSEANVKVNVVVVFGQVHALSECYDPEIVFVVVARAKCYEFPGNSSIMCFLLSQSEGLFTY